MPRQPDLFGNSPAQGDLFGEAGETGWRPPPVDTQAIRQRLLAMLADLRGAERGSPWPHETTRLNRVLFPQMANWLPEDERRQLVFDFGEELKRLDLAA